MPVTAHHIPISFVVDGVEVRGAIETLFENDMTVALEEPTARYSTGLHVPYFAMGHHRLATRSGSTLVLTPYGRETAEWLLQQCYRHARGEPTEWRVERVSS